MSSNRAIFVVEQSDQRRDGIGNGLVMVRRRGHHGIIITEEFVPLLFLPSPLIFVTSFCLVSPEFLKPRRVGFTLGWSVACRNNRFEFGERIEYGVVIVQQFSQRWDRRKSRSAEHEQSSVRSGASVVGRCEIDFNWRVFLRKRS